MQFHKCPWNFEYTEKCNPKTMVESGICMVHLRWPSLVSRSHPLTRRKGLWTKLNFMDSSAVHSPFQSPCRVQVLYLFYLICSLSLFRFRQWPFATVGLNPLLTPVSSTTWIMSFCFCKTKRGGTLAIFMKYWMNFGNLWAWVFYAILHKCSSQEGTVCEPSWIFGLVHSVT